MTKVQPPPIYQPIIDDPKNPVAALQWILFFNSIANGDQGQAWSPLLNNITEVGGVPTVAGQLYQISNAVAMFTVNIIPPSGGSTSNTAGTGYISNFPLTMQENGICGAVSGLLGANLGMCDLNSNHIYPPAWNTVTVPLTVFGLVAAQ